MKKMLATIAAALLLATSALAQTSPQVVITSAGADPGLVNLSIYGRNFSRLRDLQVTISGFGAPLAVISSSDTSITALLPLGISAGSYTLTVGSVNGANGDSIDITLAAQRPVATTLLGLAGSPCMLRSDFFHQDLPSVVDVVVEPNSGRITLTCRPWPPGSVPQGTYEALAQTAATIRAALDLFTATGNFPVDAGCNPPIMQNCPGGVPTPTQIHIEQASVTVTPITPTSYTFTVEERLATVTDIQFVFQGVQCGLSIDTTRSGSPTMHITGSAVIDSNPPPDPPNRIRFTSLSVTGVEGSDVVVSGPAACAALNGSGEFTLVEQQFSTHFSSVCGAPGPTLFVPCP